MSRHMLSHRDKGTPLYERLGKQGSHAIGAPVVRRLGSHVDGNAMAVRGWKRSAALSVCDGEH